jgi:hypothetical protein
MNAKSIYVENHESSFTNFDTKRFRTPKLVIKNWGVHGDLKILLMVLNTCRSDCN